MGNNPDRHYSHPSKGIILITDDNPNNIRILHGMLEEEGYSVRVTLDGAQALESIRADKPDLLLLDINMPGMNGYEVCRILKASEETRNVPVVFISALDSPVDKVTAFSCGGVDYITKPFQINEVIARVETHLRLYRLQMKLEELVTARTAELQKALKQLKIAHKRLEMLSRTKSEFLSMISHEMRTPLNGILGLTDLVMDECVDAQAMDEIKPMYAQAKQRMLDLLNDSMNLDRLEIADGEIVFTRISADDLIKAFQEGLESEEFTIEYNPPQEEHERRYLYLDEVLILKCLNTIAQMTDLCRNSECTKIRATNRDDALELMFPLAHCEEPVERLKEVFSLDSTARNQSEFDPLGLSPVVTAKTLSLFDGNLDVIKPEPDSSPTIQITLPFDTIHS